MRRRGGTSGRSRRHATDSDRTAGWLPECRRASASVEHPVEPRGGRNYSQSLRAAAEVQVPEGKAIERVEFYLDETLVATLYQPPFAQPILLPEGNPLAYVRAVAYLP